MWDNFLGAWAKGGKCATTYVPPDWDSALKKQQLTRRGGRRCGGGGARGKDRVGGNICEATTLWKGSAACPPVCKAASCTTRTHTNAHMHMVGDAHTKKKVLIGKEECMKTVLASVTKAWLIIFWNFICFVMHWNRLLDIACFNCDGGKWIEFDFGHKVCGFEFVFG